MKIDSASDGRSKRRGGLAWLLVPLVATTLFACFSGGPSSPRAPRQGWWDDRGPVVPHDDFPGDCTLCHTGLDWTTIREDFEYDHLAETGVELVGAHAAAECLRCHNDRGPVATFAARGCAGCHEDVHEGELGRDCELCHNEVDWRPVGAVADHSRTRFPLFGAHAAVACWRCHPGAEIGDFVGAPVECVGCHSDDLGRATDPDHLALGWIDDCERCHRPLTWGAGGFRHAFFPLTGAHAVIDCTDCHENGVFSGLSSDCYDCHSDDYASATSLDHVAFGISTDCERCHSTRNWEDADFDHTGITNACVDCHQSEYDATTDPDHLAVGFSTQCEDCHSTRRWEDANFDHVGITTGCVDCHQTDYDGTNDPNHVTAGFSTQCEDCHGTDTWLGAFFSHDGITTGCVDCHLDDYQNADDPNHVSAGFPTSCESCHGTTNWGNANFDHNFPIDDGDHRNLDCTDCHTTPGNYAVFTCIDCHAHRESRMAEEHDEVDDYVWQTSACYGCHPTGEDD